MNKLSFLRIHIQIKANHSSFTARSYFFMDALLNARKRERESERQGEREKEREMHFPNQKTLTHLNNFKKFQVFNNRKD